MKELGWSKPIVVTFPCCGEQYEIQAKALTNEPIIGTDQRQFACPDCGKTVTLYVTGMMLPGSN